MSDHPGDIIGAFADAANRRTRKPYHIGDVTEMVNQPVDGEMIVTRPDREAAATLALNFGRPCECGSHGDLPLPEELAPIIARAMAPERARAARMEKALRKLREIGWLNYDEGCDCEDCVSVREARAALGEEAK